MAVPGKRLTKLWAVIVYVLLFAYAQAEDAPAIGFVNMSIPGLFWSDQINDWGHPKADSTINIYV